MNRRARRHALEFSAYRLVSRLVIALPEGVALRLGGALGWVAGVVGRLRRGTVDENLARAFPDRTRGWRAAVARASYAHLGREAVAMLRMARLDAEAVRARTTVEGLDELRGALRGGRGVLVVTGHLGNWEIGGAALAARGIEVDAVAKPMANDRFDDALLETRRRLGMRVVETGRAPREVLEALAAGRVVALLADQNAHRGGIFVPFFGRLAATPRGPAVFALRADVPLFLGVAYREEGWPQRYRITLTRVEADRTGGVEADVRALTRAHVAALEAAVRKAPGQYFWHHKRWKTRPPEEPPYPPAV